MENYPEQYKSELMKMYPNFLDYLKTQRTFDEILSSVKGTGSAMATNEAKYSLNLPRKKLSFIEMGENDCPEGWEDIFNEFYPELMFGIEEANSHIKAGKNIYPSPENVFRVFHLIRPEDIKVIILGIEPYFYSNTANGIAYGCLDKPQSNLKAIFSEIKRTEGGEPSSANLESWVKQGVFLFNICLTVNEGKANSHGKIWKSFTFGLLNYLFENLDNIVLMLWGTEVKKIKDGKSKEKIDFNLNTTKKIKVLEANYPTTTNKMYPFLGCNNFAEANEYLIDKGKTPIDWTI